MSQSFLVTFDERQKNLLLTCDTNETSCIDPAESHEQVLVKSQSSAQSFLKTPKSKKKDARIPPLTSIGLMKEGKTK
jgi:hypothetical protein